MEIRLQRVCNQKDNEKLRRKFLEHLFTEAPHLPLEFFITHDQQISNLLANMDRKGLTQTFVEARDNFRRKLAKVTRTLMKPPPLFAGGGECVPIQLKEEKESDGDIRYHLILDEDEYLHLSGCYTTEEATYDAPRGSTVVVQVDPESYRKEICELNIFFHKGFLYCKARKIKTAIPSVELWRD